MTTIQQIAKSGSNEINEMIAEGISKLYSSGKISKDKAIPAIRKCGKDMLADYINLTHA